MDLQSAIRFKTHMEAAIREMSSGLILAQEASTADEFAAIKKSTGDIIARIDTLLCHTIYPEHPHLDDLRNGGST